jgi:ribosomal protein S27AE
MHMIVTQAGTSIQRAYCAAILNIAKPSWREELSQAFPSFVFDRNDNAVHEWRKAVLLRDKRTCQRCGSKSKLHAHHIIRWTDCVELRADVDNGLTLCQTCHVTEHSGDHREVA